MNHLATITDEDVIEGATNMSPKDFYKRRAARAVVVTDSGQLYLLHMSNYEYHKLPGGGIDEGEEVEAALYREIEEEIGCPAEIVDEVGEIREYRSKERWDQTSYCYLAKQTGELVPTRLEPGEIEEGAETVVAKDIDEAIRLLEQDMPTSYEGNFIQRRDLLFLRTARDLILK